MLYFRRTPDTITCVVLEAVQREEYAIAKYGDLINVFPSVISVVGTLVQILITMCNLQETVGGISIPKSGCQTSKYLPAWMYLNSERSSLLN